MKRQDLVRRAATTVAIGGAVLFASLTAFATHGFSRANEDSICANEELRHSLAAGELERALARGEDELAAELARTEDRAFEEFCACLRAASAESEGVGPRAPLVTVPSRGTPSRSRPILTPPAGPTARRTPVTPPSTPRRGRPVFTPPATPPGRPPVTRPTPPPLTPRPTRTP